MSEAAPLNAGGRATVTRPYLARQGKGSRALILLFLLSLIVLTSFYLAGIRLTPHRLFLVVVVVPLLLQWVTGLCGPMRVADFLVILFSLWVFLSYMVNQGMAQIPNAGMTVVETLGPYFLARRCVRDRESFLFFAKAMLAIMVVFSVTVAAEALAGFRLYEKLLSLIGQGNSIGVERRLGMIRSSGPFEHPILYGVFCASCFSVLYHMPRGKEPRRAGFRFAVFSAIATLFSLSMGAFLNVFIQFGLIAWNAVLHWLKQRWWLLLFLAIFAYVFVDVLSNRTPFEVFISYATFDYGNAYMRVVIFIEGMTNVRSNPVFGFGVCCWVRPAWMWSIPSVDNYWLLVAMRHGIPAFFLILAAWLAIIIGLVRARDLDTVDANIRLGLVYVLIGLMFSMATVHLWGPSYGLVMFILGAGAWLSDYSRPRDDAEDGSDAVADEHFRQVRYTRFPAAQPRSGTFGSPQALSDRAKQGRVYSRVEPAGPPHGE